jgi:hypothetical protein
MKSSSVSRKTIIKTRRLISAEQLSRDGNDMLSQRQRMVITSTKPIGRSFSNRVIFESLLWTFHGAIPPPTIKEIHGIPNRDP